MGMATDYEKRAHECLALAEKTPPHLRPTLLKIAEAWLMLAVDALYTFSLTVLDTVSLDSSTSSVQVSIEQSDLVAIISGGGTQAVLLGKSITLDASSSFDKDVAGESER